MFRHVVMLRWVEKATEEQKQAVPTALSELPERIPEIRSYRMGHDAGLSADNFDFVVVADFDDESAFCRYRDHPVHAQIIDEHIRPILAQRSALQHHW